MIKKHTGKVPHSEVEVVLHSAADLKLCSSKRME